MGDRNTFRAIFDSICVRIEDLVDKHCIVLYLSPVLNPMSYDGARLYKAPGRPMVDKQLIGIQKKGITARVRKYPK